VISSHFVKAVFYAAILAFVTHSACGVSDNGTCKPKQQTYCKDDVSYWVDSCGRLGDVEEYCLCGCSEDHSGCADCNCTCQPEDMCCDGCHPLDDGTICDDKNPVTLNDLCRAGSCSGWNPDDIDRPVQPYLPQEPQKPVLVSWSCPEDWECVEHGTLLDDSGSPLCWCRPPPLPRLKLGEYTTPLREGEQAGERPICDPAAEGSFPVLGQTDCQSLGNQCPGGQWPDIPPEVGGTRIYVISGASGGDGSIDAPFASIGSAVAAAENGDVLLIGEGVYTESVTISKNLVLWGKCVQETIIEAPEPYVGNDAGAIVIDGPAEVLIANLRISGARNGVRILGGTALARLEGVWIHDSTGYALLGGGAAISIVDSLITLTEPDPAGERGGGLAFWDSGQVDIERTTVEKVRSVGILAGVAGTVLQMQDVAIRGVLHRGESQSWGRGGRIMTQASATWNRGLIEGNLGTGFDVLEEGTQAELTNIVIRDNQGVQEDDMAGEGLEVAFGAELKLKQGLLSNNRGLGLALDDAGSLANLEDVVILDTGSIPQSQELGVGIQVSYGAQLTAERLVLDGNTTGGVNIALLDSFARVDDFAILNTLPQESDGAFGMGICAQQRARIDLNRGLVANNRDHGVLASGQGTQVNLTDIVISDTKSSQKDLLFGRGLAVLGGAQASGARLSLLRNREVAVLSSGQGSVLDVQDLAVANTRHEEASGGYGLGLGTQEGGRIQIRRALLEHNRAVGILASGLGTTADIQDLTISDTLGQLEDPEYPEHDLWFGRGLEVTRAAQVSILRARLVRNREAGILVAHEGSLVSIEDLDVSDTLGRQADNEWGMGVQVAYGANLEISRGLISDNRVAGLVASGDGSSVVLDNIHIDGTKSSNVNGTFGFGLEILDGAQAVLVEGKLSGNHELGAAAYGPGSVLDLERVAIWSTYERECVEFEESRNCRPYGMGINLGAYSDSVIKFESVDISGSEFIGVQLYEGGTLEGTGLSISHNPIGANVQSTPQGYDFFESVDGLRMRSNQVNFDSAGLPVPQPTMILE